MHNQHRSPDPTKIERATATSTVALFFIFSNIYMLIIFYFIYILISQVTSSDGTLMRVLLHTKERVVGRDITPPTTKGNSGYQEEITSLPEA